MSEKRKHDRLPLSAEVEVRKPDANPLLASTKDFSEGGLFIRLPASQRPAIGTVLTLQLKTPLGGDEPAPEIRARVVRQTDEGVGVMFLDDTAD
jgi:c-di-GMP-binding flagellar brake protein YcgR